MAVGGQRAQVRGHLVLAAPRIAVQTQAGARFQPGAGVVGGVEQLVVVLHLAIVVGRLQLPVRAQLVGVFGERVLLGGVPVGPVLGGGGAAIPLGLRAVAVHEGQRAPHVAVGLALLPGIAEGERAVVADLAIDDAVQEITLVLLGAQPGVSLFMRGDNAPCPAAIGGERRRVIGFGAHRGPGTVAQSERALALVGGALAHIVDGAGGIAHAGQQAIGAADHFQLLVAERVHGTGDDAPVVGQADAIDLRVGDVEAARGEGGPVGFPLIHLDAGGQAQRFIEAVGAEFAHLGGVHDADGLRRVLDVQVQVGGAVAHAVGALRDHQHGVQIGGGVAGDRRDGGGFLGRSQGGRRQRGQGQANRRAEAVGGGRGDGNGRTGTEGWDAWGVDLLVGMARGSAGRPAAAHPHAARWTQHGPAASSGGSCGFTLNANDYRFAIHSHLLRLACPENAPVQGPSGVRRHRIGRWVPAPPRTGCHRYGRGVAGGHHPFPAPRATNGCGDPRISPARTWSRARPGPPPRTAMPRP